MSCQLSVLVDAALSPLGIGGILALGGSFALFRVTSLPSDWLRAIALVGSTSALAAMAASILAIEPC